MRVKLISCAALVLSGCGTAAGIRNNSPSLQFTTGKSAEEVVRCVGPRWADIYGSQSVMPTQDGWAIIVGDPPEIVLDATEDGAVTLYMAKKIWFNIDDRYKNAVRACA